PVAGADLFDRLLGGHGVLFIVGFPAHGDTSSRNSRRNSSAAFKSPLPQIWKGRPSRPVRSAQRALQPHTTSRMSLGSPGRAWEKERRGKAAASCCTRATRSYRGLQPPQYLTPTVGRSSM